MIGRKLVKLFYTQCNRDGLQVHIQVSGEKSQKLSHTNVKTKLKHGWPTKENRIELNFHDIFVLFCRNLMICHFRFHNSPE